jgi:hypothetical protein
MRNRMYLLLVVLLLCSIQLQAQTLEEIAKTQMGPEQRVNGIVATFSSFVEGRATTEGVLRFYYSDGDENVIGSLLINPSTGMLIGYAMVIERLPDPKKLKITIKSPSESESEIDGESFSKNIFGALVLQKLPKKPKITVTPPPSYPEPIVINVNDVIKIPLWVNAGTEWGIVGDQIRFAIDRPKPARDFTLDDVPLKLTNYRLLINGEVRSGEREIKGIEHPLPFFYVPGKGTFMISIRPHNGHDFQKIAVAEENKISFSYGADKYELVSSEPVIAQGGNWHLWVLHDPDWQPSPDLVEAFKLLSKGNCCVFAAADPDYYNKPPPPKK